MKKSIIILSFGLILLIGCKQESLSPNELNPDDHRTEKINYVLNTDGENSVWEVADLSSLLDSSSVNSNLRQSNSAFTRGYYTQSRDRSTSFFGVQDTSGVTGSAVIEDNVFFPPAGPPFFFPVRMVLETASVVVIGDEAIYCGLIVESTGSPFPGGGPFALGRYFYIRVKDNSHSSNTTPDQRYRTKYSISSLLSDGGASLAWSGGMKDIINPGDYVRVR
jgi:hypothetical protein